MKVGFVAILGRPNAGKSTFLNAVLSKKVSIVTPKAQTTRDSICGILTEKERQIVFVDTPGIFFGEGALDRYMKKSAFDSSKDVDAILYLIDGSAKDLEPDFSIIEGLRSTAPRILILNKIDLLRIEEGEAKKKAIRARFPDYPLLEASFLKNFGIKEVKEEIEKYLVEGEPFYPEDTLTDKDLSYRAKEIIRQELLHFLKQEIPHQSAVLIKKFAPDGDGYRIEARVILNKKNHKSIVIGKGGEMIKKISMSARHEMERVFKKHIHSLDIEVEVKEDWRNDPAMLKKLGYAND